MAASISNLQSRAADTSAPLTAAQRDVLGEAARAFLTDLHHRFDGRRLALLRARDESQARYDAGELPDFASETATIRDADWRVAAIPGRAAGSTRRNHRPGRSQDDH